LAATPCFGNDDNPSLVRRYHQLKEVALKSGQDGHFETKILVIKNQPVSIIQVKKPVPTVAPVNAGELPVKIGVRIWGEVIQGPNKSLLFNLEKYRFQPGEQFYIWMEAATPIHLGMFELFPDSPSEPNQLLPDERGPESFKTLLPGEKFRFPYSAYVETHQRDEVYSIVIVAADSGGLPINDPAWFPNSDNSDAVDKLLKSTRQRFAELQSHPNEVHHAPPSGTPATITTVSLPGGTMKARRMKGGFNFAKDASATSADPDQVATYYVGEASQGQFQFKLSKTRN
jgi:hypothetical protein